MRALLIDDDGVLAELLVLFMAKHDVNLEHAFQGASGLELLRRGTYDILLLDVTMPTQDGFSVLADVRAVSTIPVIMLTARGEESDRLRGFDLGADDYVPKPFSSRELLRRMRAVLRRGQPEPQTRIEFNGAVLDFQSSILITAAGEQVLLTDVESALLRLLIQRRGQAVSRELIYHSVFARASSPTDRSLDTHIYNLRQKLAVANNESLNIRSIRGVGYQMTLPVKSPT